MEYWYNFQAALILMFQYISVSGVLGLRIEDQSSIPGDDSDVSIRYHVNIASESICVVYVCRCGLCPRN